MEIHSQLQHKLSNNVSASLLLHSFYTCSVLFYVDMHT